MNKVHVFIKNLNSNTWKDYINKHQLRIATGDRYFGELIEMNNNGVIIEGPKIGGEYPYETHRALIEYKDIEKITNTQFKQIYPE